MDYLVTMFQKRLGIHAAYDHQLRQLPGEDVFTETVPNAKDFKEAVAGRMPLANYKPRCAALKSMDAVAAEMLERATRLAAEAPKFLLSGNRAGIGVEAEKAQKAG